MGLGDARSALSRHLAEVSTQKGEIRLPPHLGRTRVRVWVGVRIGVWVGAGVAGFGSGLGLGLELGLDPNPMSAFSGVRVR